MKCNTYKEMPAHILGNTGVTVGVFLETINIIDKISNHTSTVNEASGTVGHLKQVSMIRQ